MIFQFRNCKIKRRIVLIQIKLNYCSLSVLFAMKKQKPVFSDECNTFFSLTQNCWFWYRLPLEAEGSLQVYILKILVDRAMMQLIFVTSQAGPSVLLCVALLNLY